MRDTEEPGGHVANRSVAVPADVAVQAQERVLDNVLDLVVAGSEQLADVAEQRRLEPRDELVEIWSDPDIPVNTIILVTHIIEEAVELADRILILSKRPGEIAADISIDLPRPRSKRDPAFTDVVDKVFSRLA